MNALTPLASAALVVITAFALSFLYADLTAPDYGVALPQAPAVFETSLQSRISATDTSMTLVSNSVRGGSTLSGYQCFTIDEGRTDAEFVCGTISGTTVSNLERGIDPLNATSTNAALKFAHRVGSPVKVTDFPIIQRLRNLANGNETFPNPLFVDVSTSTIAGLGTSTIPTKEYVDFVGSSGCSNASETARGCVEIATQAEAASSTSAGSTGARLAIPASMATSSPGIAGLWSVVTTNAGKISQTFFDLTQSFTWSGTHTFAGGLTTVSASSFNATTSAATSTRVIDFDVTVSLVASTTMTGYGTPQPVYVATSTGTVRLSDGNVPMDQAFDGFAISSATNGQTVYVQIEGIVTGFSGLTKGADYYVQDAVGTIGTSVGTSEIYVGRAISATEILIVRSRSHQYNGTASGGSTTYNVPAHTRFIVIQSSGGSATVSYVGEMTLSKVGRTSGSIGSSSCCSLSTYSISASWNTTTNVLTMTDSGHSSVNNTIYYYR